MIDEINQLLHDYHVWLKDKTSLRPFEEWIEITTPYLDRHNDYIQIYAKKSNGGFVLTDDGYTIEDLELSGCKLNSPKRQDLLETILNGFGVKNEDQVLVIEASKQNFALKKHNLLQSILAVNDMFYLATPMVYSIFYEDVVAWMELHNIRYTPKVKFTGKSGYDHLFDFVIPKSRQQPERIIQTINRPTRDTSQSVAFAWIDTKDVRSPDSQAYAILNDTESTIASNVIGALKSYRVKPILWSCREQVKEELAA